MLTDFIVSLFMLCVRVVMGIVYSALALAMHLLGPGVLWVMVAVAFFWYFGWLSPLWNATVSLIW